MLQGIHSPFATANGAANFNKALVDLLVLFPKVFPLKKEKQWWWVVRVEI